MNRNIKIIGDIGITYTGLSGKTKDDFGHGDAQYITFLNVLNNPVIDTSIFDNVDVKAGEKQNRCRKGDLFFNTSSETPEEVGMCAYLADDVPDLYLNSFCFGFHIKDKDVDGKYLSYYFRGKQGRKLMTMLAQGATRYNLSKENFMASEIELPLSDEQSRIATALYDIDTLIRNLDRTIEKKQNIKQGAMQELLSSQKRLKGFAEEWKEMSLEEMGFLTAGGTPSTMNPEYWGGDINWLQSGAVQNCLIMPDAVEKKITRAGLQNSSAYLIRPNSVLIAITGATCANVGFLTFESAANQSVVSIEPYEDYDAIFLYQKLLTEKTNILSNKGGSAQSGVTLKALKQLTILVPPTIQEQRAIADLLTAMDDEIAVLQMERDKYANIRSGMMDDLLTGAKRI